MSAAHRERGDARAVESERESVGSLGLREKGGGPSAGGCEPDRAVSGSLAAGARGDGPSGRGVWAGLGLVWVLVFFFSISKSISYFYSSSNKII